MATDSWGHSWGGPFTRWIMWGAADQVTVATFGPPFLDLRSAIRTTLGATSPMIQAVGVRSAIDSEIELQSLLPSSRIDRSHL